VGLVELEDIIVLDPAEKHNQDPSIASAASDADEDVCSFQLRHWMWRGLEQ